MRSSTPTLSTAIASQVTYLLMVTVVNASQATSTTPSCNSVSASTPVASTNTLSMVPASAYPASLSSETSASAVLPTKATSKNSMPAAALLDTL